MEEELQSDPETEAEIDALLEELNLEIEYECGL